MRRCKCRRQVLDGDNERLLNHVVQHQRGRGRQCWRLQLLRRPPPHAAASPAPRRGRGRAPAAAAILHRVRQCGGGGVDVVLIGGVAGGGALAAPERGAPDVARDVVDGALVRTPERERGALRRHARRADAVLLLEAAQLLDELALGEVEGEAAADLLVEGARVVLVRRERGAPARREVERSEERL